MSISISSRKAKGRNLQNKTKQMILEYYTELEDGDVKPAIMGESGRDIGLSPRGEQLIPFDIECKAHEKLNVWSSMDQACRNSIPGRIPLVVFKKNYSKVYCMLEFDQLLELIKK